MRRLIGSVRALLAGQRSEKAPAGRYFAILAVQRSGSQLLQETLSQFPEIVCFGELFNAGLPKEEDHPDLLGWTKERRNADLFGFLEELKSLSADKIPGFRILMNAHMPGILERVTCDDSCVHIVLRRDPIESYVSLKLARMTGVWRLSDPAERISAKVCFDGSEFEAYRDKVEAFHVNIDQRMRTSRVPICEIDYSELRSPQAIYRLAHAIGATSFPASLQERTIRQNPGSVLDKLENPEDLRAWRDLHQS